MLLPRAQTIRPSSIRTAYPPGRQQRKGRRNESPKARLRQQLSVQSELIGDEQRSCRNTVLGGRGVAACHHLRHGVTSRRITGGGCEWRTPLREACPGRSSVC